MSALPLPTVPAPSVPLPRHLDAATAQPRLGYCCKWLSPEGDAKAERAMNATSTTIAALGRMERGAAFDKVLAIVAHNVESIGRQIEEVAARPPLERLLRLVSGVFPAYTHPVGSWMYAEPAMRELVEPGLARVGALARERGVRLSMHPGPFCVLATLSEGALANAIGDFEYHVDVMRMMGMTGGWHPYGTHLNIHAGARAPGLDGVRAGLARLSEEGRGLVTLENDETSYGLDALLPLAGEVAIVLDLHHHWCASGGEYVQPDDPRIARVEESWRGTRPVCHTSQPREGYFEEPRPASLPDHATLVAAGLKGRDLQAHSDMMWNEAINDLVGAHLSWADFEVEAKSKNLASEALARHVEARGLPAAASRPQVAAA